MNGIINIYKEKGYTSHDVVAIMRGILRIRKIGHTGTLDPEAEGVLPVCIGKATKLADMITDKSKTYETVLRLGVVTDTQDMTGKIIKTFDVDVDYEDIVKAASCFIGEYEQLPPMYSAIKVNGKKLYELARQGKEVERKRRKVAIHDIRITGYDRELHEAKMLVDCGKGTYIRTLLHDMGKLLGCGGCMKSLVRTRVGEFTAKEALRLSQVEELLATGHINSYVKLIDEILDEYPKIIVDSNIDKLVHNGNSFRIESEVDYAQDEQVRVYDSSRRFIGIYRHVCDCENDNITFKPVKMFL